MAQVKRKAFSTTEVLSSIAGKRLTDAARHLSTLGRGVVSPQLLAYWLKQISGHTTAGQNERILFISDIHAPYHHPNTLEFLKMLKDKYKPTRVVSVGDEVDKHGLSYHESNPDLKSAGDELIAAKEFIKELYELFPVMDIMESNHGSLHLRKAMTAGLPRAYIKSYNEVLGVGEGWKWHPELILELPNGQQCYVCHGKLADASKLSQNMGMNVVQGHYHSEFSIKFWSNPNNLFFGMAVGCLIDDTSLAMAYNKLTPKRPIIGTGLIIDSKPVLEYMPL